MDICERLFGSPEALAPVCGCAEKSPYGWRQGSANRDAGDIPSARHMRALLTHAAAKGLPLTADDLIFGTSQDELTARLGQPVPAAPAPDASACRDAGPTGGGCVAPTPFVFRSRAGRPVDRAAG